MQMTTALTLIIGSYLAVIHFLALLFKLYWRYWWFDCVVHVIGGIFLVLLFTTLQRYSWWPWRGRSRRALISFAIVCMVIWEIFGVVIIGGFKDGFIGDTFLDLVCGIVGSVLGVIFYRSLRQLQS